MENIDSKNSHEEFPYTIQKVEEGLNNKIVETMKAHPNGFVQVGPEKWFLPAKYAHCAEDIYKFKVRPDDVFICTHPRSGTTWTQEMIWLICNDFDYGTASRLKLNKRFPYLEYSN